MQKAVSDAVRYLHIMYRITQVHVCQYEVHERKENERKRKDLQKGGKRVKEIRDCKGRIACKGDAATGVIETLYKGCKTRSRLPVGEDFIIEREGIRTTVTRISISAFKVESRAYAA